MELFRLFGTVLIDDKEAIESLKKVDKNGESTSKKLGGIADKGLAIGTAVIAGTGAAITGMLKLSEKTADTADHIDKMSQKLGLSREAYQQWDFILSQSGTSIDSMKGGIKTLTNQFDDLKNGGDVSTEAFGRLGLKYEDLAGMTQEQLFETTVTALQGVTDTTERAALANDLLGKSGAELAPLLNSGAGSIEEMKNKADELGLVLSDQTIDAGVVFTDTMDQAKRSVGTLTTGIGADVMPMIQKMLDWFIAHMPEIREIVSEAFDKISEAIGWVTDHINIILPVLGLFFTAMVAMKIISVISGLITAWSTVTKIASGIQLAFNAVMAANPIALVILAITALIAIGVLLWKNWDKIKEFAQGLWDKIKAVFTGIKDDITTRINLVKDVLTLVFGKIKDIMSAPFEKARDIIKGVIDKIKGFLNFNWEFPKLKMPHFSVTGSMNPLKWIDEGLPKIGVEWYAKGGIFDKPTIFNTPYGLKGVGDASSPEVVSPLSDLKAMLADSINSAVVSAMSVMQPDNEIIVESNTYFGDDKIYNSVKRAKKAEGKRKGYTVANEF